MLIYEKNNKLNINFDNEINENPDLQIGKNGDKTEVLVDGSSNPTIPVPVLPEDVGKTIVVNEDGSYALANAGGGSTAPLVVSFTASPPSFQVVCDKSYSEIKNAYDSGRIVLGKDNPENMTNIINYNSSSEKITFIFIDFSVSNNKNVMSYYKYSISSNNAVTTGSGGITSA
jgi:hypothetical protein